MATTTGLVNLRWKRDPILGPAFEARVDDETSTAELSERARDMLGRYAVLMKRELAGLTFSRAEVMAMLDAVNGWFVTPDSVPYLHVEVENALEDGLAGKWGVDGPALVARLKGLGLGARFALVDALEQAWRQAPRHGNDLEKAARAVGLLREEK